MLNQCNGEEGVASDEAIPIKKHIDVKGVSPKATRRNSSMKRNWKKYLAREKNIYKMAWPGRAKFYEWWEILKKFWGGKFFDKYCARGGKMKMVGAA